MSNARKSFGSDNGLETPKMTRYFNHSAFPNFRGFTCHPSV